MLAVFSFTAAVRTVAGAIAPIAFFIVISAGAETFRTIAGTAAIFAFMHHQDFNHLIDYKLIY
jgi:hypothetical protein